MDVLSNIGELYRIEYIIATGGNTILHICIQVAIKTHRITPPICIVYLLLHEMFSSNLLLNITLQNGLSDIHQL